MATGSFAASLAQLTGLDQETAQTQLLPHLDSLKSQAEIKNYLDSLLAPGPAAQSFTNTYISQRFPSAPSRPSSSSRQGWATPSSSRPSPTSSRAPSEDRQRSQNLERVLAAAPKGGKVYIKTKEEDLDGWGGVKSGNRSGGSSRAASQTRSAGGASGSAHAAPAPSPLHPAPPGALPPPATAPRHTQQLQQKGKGKAQEPELELSEEAAKELLRIERELRSFEPKKAGAKSRVCFCQARQHPLSTYIPLCPRCSLVLCSLNIPSAPCPSCSHGPLLSSALTASHIATLQSSRETLLTREKRRAQAEREQAERERAAIRFPELGMDVQRAPLPGMGPRSYAGHAGGGMSMSDRIDRAYEARHAAHTEHVSAGAAAGGKVLRLDGKTGKVKVQKKVAKPSTTRGGKTILTEETVAVVDPEDDDGLIAWIDEDDDGVRGERALRSLRAEEIARRTVPDDRPFFNVTLDEDERPLWTPPAEVDEGEAADEAGEAGTADTAAPGPASAAKPAVPGAAVVKDESKGKRRRGRGGKGKRKAEGAAAE
ncbi:hypothetical protein NBRC10513v2_007578 [Rhodotorula toruloides]|uniref:TRIP4/RQT4 C2HC5-type zinc finger domain-containing protein n=1 Tax=Rhodotorula toruloides TaxID=5286 RepID=A0A2S9ZXH0_RHOTO|nr:hypothetical protein AAT19DRAFT_11204 [Rhodotorula toruloides]